MKPSGSRQAGVSEKSERAEAVVDRDDDDVALTGQMATPIEEDRAASRGEPPAVNPHHHRAPRCADAGSSGTSGVQMFKREAVLALDVPGARDPPGW